MQRASDKRAVQISLKAKVQRKLKSYAALRGLTYSEAVEALLSIVSR